MTREELKNAIPHGYGKVIAQQAGVTPKAVSDFLKGKTNSQRIKMVALKVLADIRKSEKELTDQIN